MQTSKGAAKECISCLDRKCVNKSRATRLQQNLWTSVLKPRLWMDAHVANWRLWSPPFWFSQQLTGRLCKNSRMYVYARACVCLYHVWVVWPGGATSGSSPLTFQPRLPRPSTHRWSWKLVLAKHIFSGLCFSGQGVCQRGASGEIGLIRLVFILSYYMLKMWSDKEAQTQS